MKTTLSFLRKQDWRTVKSEIEKVNDLLTNIPINDITELNDLIYVVCEKKSESHWRPQTEKENPGENSDLNRR